MKRVALYARVSGDKQEREETINSQLAQLRTLATQKGLTVLDRYVYLDDGYSGDLLARPGLDRLRDGARDCFFDLVLVHSPDRLARRYAYQVVVIEELQKYGCEVDFVNRKIAPTPEDQMLLAMQGVIAEYERAKIMERTRRGRLYKLQTGTLVAPHPPYGYRWNARQAGEHGRIEIVPEHAEIIQQIYRWMADGGGHTIISIARRLIQNCTPAPKGGARWNTSTVLNILRNRAYIGEFCFNRFMAVESKEPAKPGIYRRRRLTATSQRPKEEWIIVPGPTIIDRDLFNAVQERLAENKQFAMRHASPENPMLLRCLVRCGQCGYSLASTHSRPGRNGRLFRYYVCTKRLQHNKYGDCVPQCNQPHMKAEILDEVVWNDLRTVMSDPARITHHAGLEPDTTPERLQGEAQRLAQEVQACDRQTQRLLDAYQGGAIEIDNLLRRRRDIDGRKEILSNALKQAEATLHDSQLRHDIRAQLPDFVRQVTASLDRADFSTRQRLVRLLIDRVVVHSNLEVEIYYVLAALGRIGDPTCNPPGSDSSPSGPDTPVSSDFALHSHRQSPLVAGAGETELK